MSTKISLTRSLRQILFWLPENERTLLSDRYAKKLTVAKTIILYLEAIIRKRPSVSNIANHLKSCLWLQRWLNLTSIHQSSLNRQLAELPTDLLRDMYEAMLTRVTTVVGAPRKIRNLGPLAAVDSSSISLGKIRGEWAYLQKGKCAVKMHTCLHLTDDHSAHPAATVLSTASVADLDGEVLDQLVTDARYTYLFDRGYIHYAKLLKWDQDGLKWVLRLKSNSKVRILRKHPQPRAPILLDAEVELVDPHTGDKGVFRLVEYTYTDKKGKTHRVRVLTNRWDLQATDVALLYNYRWKVELFFKFMKQQLHLKKIYNSKPTAVWNYIYLNLIAYLICEYQRLHHLPDRRLGEMIAYLKSHLDEIWEALLAALHPIRTRTSKGRQKKAIRGRPRIHPRKLKTKRMLYY